MAAHALNNACFVFAAGMSRGDDHGGAALRVALIGGGLVACALGIWVVRRSQVAQGDRQ
jgi:hypothetical protein